MTRTKVSFLASTAAGRKRLDIVQPEPKIARRRVADRVKRAPVDETTDCPRIDAEEERRRAGRDERERRWLFGCDCPHRPATIGADCENAGPVLERGRAALNTGANATRIGVRRST
jgi:hypothetical protein